MRRRRSVFAGACAATLLAAGPAAAQGCEAFRVLVFSKTAGFRHDAQIAAGAALIQAIGNVEGFAVDHTEDAALFTPANLAQYAAVVFLNTTGDVLDAAQEAAFEGFVQAGGGFAGVHSAADTEYAWPFYGALLGTWFSSHPPVQPATIAVADPSHPSTAPLPPLIAHADEWYDFASNVASNPLVTVLLTVDESTYTGGTMGPVHPIAWCQAPAAGGRSWYTALGHTLATYAAPFFIAHLRGGILWAADSLRSATICGALPYGAPSGTPLLALAGAPGGPTFGTITLTGGNPGAPDLLAASACSVATAAGPLTVLVELAAPGRASLLPLVFDAAGASQLVTPLTLTLPGTLGDALFLQGAQLAPTIALSNGLELLLCP